ncbi:MAG: endolytic transglycosylase MltG [Propionibacteriaceae bacterium]|jgi:UPF0755 protein|nr:endolytic transglycosylase MltG [Propionibacteriaceae bacterium]
MTKPDGVSWISSSGARRAKSAVAVALSFIILLSCAGFGGWKVYSIYMDWRQRDDYIGAGDAPVEVYIPDGLGSVGRVADILVHYEVIQDPTVFEKVTIEQGVENQIPSGTFNLMTHLPAATALAMLLDPANKVIVTLQIKEGVRLAQIKEQLANDLKVGADQVDQAFAALAADPAGHQVSPLAPDPANLEGYLFPDTYMAEPHNPVSALGQMAHQFDLVATELDLANRAAALSAELGFEVTPQQIVIVASIIEGEVNRAEYRPKVARAIYNRLAIGQALGIESVFRYMREVMAGTPYDDGVTTAEQEDPSLEYNYYLKSSLPPVPIAAPGRDALSAALHPEAGDWRWWVTTDPETGETGFATTEEEYKQLYDTFHQWCADHGNPDALC